MNPVDVTAQIMSDPKIFGETINVLVEDKTIDTIIIATALNGPP